MAASPAVFFAILYSEGRADLRLVWLTLAIYGLALVFYCVYRLICGVFGVWREDREFAVAHAALLFTFEADANGLIELLEQVWLHWNEAGEVLLRPLEENHPKNNDTNGIQMELRDFKVSYMNHMERVRLDAPDFASTALAEGYPSSREYFIVLRDLKNHAANLGRIADSIMVKR